MGSGSPSRPPIAVVIISFNTCASLRRCLESLFHSRDAARLSIWVVDNGSQDGSAEMVAAAFPETHLIALDRNVGFARAMNLALRQIRGGHICWLNPDAFVTPDALSELEAVLDRFPRTGLVAPRILNLDGTVQASLRRRTFYRLRHRLLEAAGADQLFPPVRRMLARDRGLEAALPDDAPIEFANGACLFVSRDAAASVGLLDERFWIYSEDMDYCERVRRAGYEMRYAPAAVVHHAGGESSARCPGTMRLHLVHAKWQLLGKHFGTWSARGYRLVVLCEALRRLLGAVVRPADRRPRLRLVGDLLRWAIHPVRPSPPIMVLDGEGFDRPTAPGRKPPLCPATGLGAPSGSARRAGGAS